VVPAFNEAQVIRSTLEAMRVYLDAQTYPYEVILVADGDDQTPDLAAEIAFTWPALSVNARKGRHGKGHGLRRGMAMTHGRIVGFMDADYKTPIDEVEKILPWFERGYDLVAGSRAAAGSLVTRRQPWYRRIGSQGFGLVMHSVIGLRGINDTQCGFKFFTRAAAQDIFSRARIDGYMCDVEILWLAEQLGYRVKEVGISWRDDGDSRLELFSGNVRNGLDLFRIRFGSNIR
jgi:dolichyl-phosphate beta-glucosyltransferase